MMSITVKIEADTIAFPPPPPKSQELLGELDQVKEVHLRPWPPIERGRAVLEAWKSFHLQRISKGNLTNRTWKYRHKVGGKLLWLEDGVDFSEPITREQFEELNMGLVKKIGEDPRSKKPESSTTKHCGPPIPSMCELFDRCSENELEDVQAHFSRGWLFVASVFHRLAKKNLRTSSFSKRRGMMDS